MIDFDQDRADLHDGGTPAETVHTPHPIVEHVWTFLNSIQGCKLEEVKASAFADLNKVQGVRRGDCLLVRHRGSEFIAKHADLKLLEKGLRDWKRPPNLGHIRFSFVNNVRV